MIMAYCNEICAASFMHAKMSYHPRTDQIGTEAYLPITLRVKTHWQHTQPVTGRGGGGGVIC